MKNKINISKSNFIGTLNDVLKHSENIEIVLDYADWQIIRIEHQFFCYSIELSGNNRGCIVFSEVHPVACLEYSITGDAIPDGEALSQLFENDVCGEQVTDENIRYWWFKEIK